MVLWVWRPAGNLNAKRQALRELQSALDEKKVEPGETGNALYLAAANSETLKAVLGTLEERGLFTCEWLDVPDAPNATSTGLPVEAAVPATETPATNSAPLVLADVTPIEATVPGDLSAPAPPAPVADVPAVTRRFPYFLVLGLAAFLFLVSVWLGPLLLKLLPSPPSPTPGSDTRIRVGLYRWPGSIGGNALPSEDFKVQYLDELKPLFDKDRYDVLALPLEDAATFIGDSKIWKVVSSPEHAHGAEHVLVYKDLESLTDPLPDPLQVFYDGDSAARRLTDEYRRKRWPAAKSVINKVSPNGLLNELSKLDERKKKVAIVGLHDPLAESLDLNNGPFRRLDHPPDPPDIATVILARVSTFASKDSEKLLSSLLRHWNDALSHFNDDLTEEQSESALKEKTGDLFPNGTTLDAKRNFLHEMSPHTAAEQAGFLYGFGKWDCRKSGENRICRLIDNSAFEHLFQEAGIELSPKERTELCESDLGVLKESEVEVVGFDPPGSSTLNKKISVDGVDAWAAKKPSGYFCVIGHADEAGTEQGNYKLGFDRSEAVIRYLQAQENPALRLIQASRGARDAGGVKKDPKKRRGVIRKHRIMIGGEP